MAFYPFSSKEFMTFLLHPQLDKDCKYVGHFPLCRLLLMDDSQFPWFILVPEVEGITEIYQLDDKHQMMLIEESSRLASQLTKLFKPDKLNIAAIGNLVPQLHVHHVVRYHHDKAWPAPVWGKFPTIPYSEDEKDARVKMVADALGF